MLKFTNTIFTSFFFMITISAGHKTLLRFLITTIFFTLLNLSITLSQESIKFNRLSINDGLSQSSVECIIQDSLGFLWFGTEDGLNRYDGYTFTVFKNDPDNPHSLSNNDIWCLFVDSRNILWIGTYSGGLNRYDPKTETFFRFKIRSITEDSSGYIWVGTSDAGINRFDPDNRVFLRFYHHPDNPNSLTSNTIRYIFPYSTDTLWIATNKGLDIYDKKKKVFIHLTATEINAISHNNIRHIYQDRSGKFWLSTANGLDRFDPATRKFKNYRHDPRDKATISGNNIRQVFEDRKGRLWVATSRSGLNYFDRSTEIFYHYNHDPTNANSIGPNGIRVIFEDRGGLLWFGSLGGGISMYNPKTDRFRHYRHHPKDINSLSNSVIWAITQDFTGNLWFGTNTGGLNRYNPETKTYTHFIHHPTDPGTISSNNIRTLLTDHQGILWVGTQNGGVNYLLPGSSQFKKLAHDPKNVNSLSNNNIRSVFEDRSEQLWFCTWGGGLNYYDQTTGKFTPFRHRPDNSNSLSSDNVISIYQDSQFVYWVGTSDGLNQLTFDENSFPQPEKSNFTRYFHDPSNPRSLSNNYILCIHESKNGDLWFGTMLGLSRLRNQDRPNPVFTRYFMKNGLPNDVIYGILEDDNGYIWLSTNNGISRLNPETETFKNFDIQDGLHSNEFNTGSYFKTADGHFIFGGVNGASEFNPESLIDNPYLPPIVLTSFEIYNQPAQLDKNISFIKQIILPYRDNHFSFEFASLDFSKPERNRYAYILEGFDENWLQSGARRYAGYTHIDPGSYIFRVAGTNGDGVWNETGASVRIIIEPPFWRTWWFILLVLTGAGGGIASIIVYRVRQLLKFERLRSKIAADLHDEIGAGLTEISIMGEVITQKLPAKPRKFVLAELQKIGETSRNLIDSMSDIVWLVNPKRDSLFDLISRLGDLYKELLDSTNITFETENLESLKNIRLNMEYRQNLFLIFKEAINNSLKYSNGTEITLETKIGSRKLLMKLTDNGAGFDTRNAAHGNGLGNMKERARSIGGSLKIDSAIGQGTTILFEGNIY
jgi:ligand-binding sensor domain-containing protein/two-component sensor histidine kinase